MSRAEPDPVSPPLDQLIANALQHFGELGYSQRTRGYYANVWRAFLEFALDTASSLQLEPRIATAFLESRGVAQRATLVGELTWSQQETRRAIRVLLDFQATGDFRRHPKRKPDPPIPGAFRRELDQYEEFCQRQLHHRPATLLARRRTLMSFVVLLGSHGILTPVALDAESLSAFITARAQQIGPSSLATEVAHLRSFVRFLGMRGLVAPDLIAHARAFRFSKEHRLPPVWPPQAVEALIAAVDRSSPQGKRDYAILLLACRLGLRATDIRSLRLDEICWSGARINLTQRKTGRPLSLPIDDEIGEALIDYLEHARPAVDHREVFLKLRAPCEPLGPGNSLYSVVASALYRAQIELPAGIPRGLHALRHTLATRLVCAGESLETVAGVLGHHSVESTRVYTHLDVETLRCVAPDPEEVLHD